MSKSSPVRMGTIVTLSVITLTLTEEAKATAPAPRSTINTRYATGLALDVLRGKRSIPTRHLSAFTRVSITLVVLLALRCAMTNAFCDVAMRRRGSEGYTCQIDPYGSGIRHNKLALPKTILNRNSRSNVFVLN